MSKIAVCVPSGDMVPADAAYRLPGVLAAAGHNCTLLNLRAPCPAANLNGLFHAALHQIEADYVLTLDADMALPPDTIPRLVAHDKDIVGVIYRSRMAPHGIHGRLPDGTEPTAPYTGLVEMSWVGGGCVLVKRQVLETLEPPWRVDVLEGHRVVLGHDVGFCLRARKLGFAVYADMDLSREVTHVSTVPLGLGCGE